MRNTLLVVFFSLVVSACSTMQSRYSVIDTPHPAKAEGCGVDVLNEIPKVSFSRISRLDVHLEKTHFIASSLEDALPELKKQACLSGADAIIDLAEQSSMLGETRIYHVTATGIRYD